MIREEELGSAANWEKETFCCPLTPLSQGLRISGGGKGGNECSLAISQVSGTVQALDERVDARGVLRYHSPCKPHPYPEGSIHILQVSLKVSPLP